MNASLRITTVLVAAMLAVVLSGCVAVVFAGGAAAGAGGAIWYSGEARTSLPGSVEQVRKASTDALEKLYGTVAADGSGPLECKLTAYAIDHRKVTVKVKYLSPGVSEVDVRVGFWGDRVASQQVLHEIEQRLK